MGTETGTGEDDTETRTGGEDENRDGGGGCHAEDVSTRLQNMADIPKSLLDMADLPKPGHPENDKKGENFPAFPGPAQGPSGFGPPPSQPFGRGGFNNDFGGFDGGFRGRGGRGGRGGWRGRGNDNF